MKRRKWHGSLYPIHDYVIHTNQTNKKRPSSNENDLLITNTKPGLRKPIRASGYAATKWLQNRSVTGSAASGFYDFDFHAVGTFNKRDHMVARLRRFHHKFYTGLFQFRDRTVEIFKLPA